MCIIAIKKRGVQFPSVETIKNMCDNNPDGFAMVYNIRGDKTRVIRSLNSDDIFNAYKELIKHSHKKVAFFMHARIKTHGTININNCHGWYSDECKMHFAHNGILKITNRDDMTDSETFLRDIFTPAFLYRGWKGAELAIDACIGTSKFVFMENDGTIHHYGPYKEDEGMLYSNDSYKEQSWRKYYSDSYSGYGGYSSYRPTIDNVGGYRRGDKVTAKEKFQVWTGGPYVDPSLVYEIVDLWTTGFYITAPNGVRIFISQANINKIQPCVTTTPSKEKDEYKGRWTLLEKGDILLAMKGGYDYDKGDYLLFDSKVSEKMFKFLNTENQVRYLTDIEINNNFQFV
jgi:hypothetical protein